MYRKNRCIPITASARTFLLQRSAHKKTTINKVGTVARLLLGIGVSIISMEAALRAASGSVAILLRAWEGLPYLPLLVISIAHRLRWFLSTFSTLAVKSKLLPYRGEFFMTADKGTRSFFNHRLLASSLLLRCFPIEGSRLSNNINSHAL